MASSSEDALTPPSSPPPAEVDPENTPPADGNQSSTPLAPLSAAKPTSREEVLSNTDILTHIFSTFLPATPSPLDAPSCKFILDLALQCRSFSEPALDCLWKHLGSLIPLIRLLPSATGMGNARYYLSGSTTGLTETFSKHAKRVRSLHIGITGQERAQVDPSVYTFLAQFLNGKPLLPGLVTVQLELVDDAFSWHTLPILFPCASLSEVVLGSIICADPLARRIALPLMVSRAPSLKSIAVYGDGRSNILMSVLEDSVFRFQHLRVLSCCTDAGYGHWHWAPIKATHSFLFDLGHRLRHLEQLPLPAPAPAPPTSADALPVAGNPDLFPNLRTLTITHRSDADILQCPGIRSLIHNLVSLTIAIRPSWMPSFTSIVDALAQCPLLRQLSLVDKGWNVSLTAENVIYILAHINLDDLRLDVRRLDGSLQTNEACLSRILTATEGLQEDPEPLRSLSLPRIWVNSVPSLERLVEVARKAPQMEYLGISLDSSHTTSRLSSLTSLTTNPSIPHSSALKYLQLRDLRGEDQPFTPAEYKVIAHYLDTCFPNLMSVNPHPLLDQDATTVGHWAHIEHLRVLYQENRRFSQSRR